MKSLAQVETGRRVGRFRAWPRDFKKDAKGNITLVLGILPGDMHDALQFSTNLDGEVLIIEAHLVAPTPKDDMRDIDRLRMLQHPAGRGTIASEDVVDLTEGRVMSNRRIIPWVFVMNRGGDHVHD